jgi:WD40 repeat protein
MRCAHATVGSRVIAVDNHRSELALWDQAGGRMTAALHRDDAYLAEIAEVNQNLRPDQEGWDFTPDGRLGIALFFGAHKVFNTLTGVETAKLVRMPEEDWEWHPRRSNPSHVTSRAVSPAGDRLAVAFEDGALILWNLSGTELWRRPVNPERNYAKHMAFSADGSRLATAAITGPLALWDTAGGTQLATFQERKNHAFCYPCACALSPDGKLAAVGRGDGSIILWDLSGY